MAFKPSIAGNSYNNYNKNNNTAMNKLLISEKEKSDEDIEFYFLNYLLNHSDKYFDTELKKEDFKTNSNFLFYSVMKAHFINEQDMDLDSIKWVCIDNQKTMTVAGIDAVIEKIKSCQTTPDTFPTVLEKFKEASYRRKLNKFTNFVLAVAAESGTAEEKCAKVNTKFLEISDINSDRAKEDFVVMDEVIDEYIDIADKYGDQGGMPIEIEWPLKSLNEHTLGISRKDFIVIGGRPGSGKSSLGFQIAEINSHKNKCVYFTLEMSAKDLIARMATKVCGTDLKNIKVGRLNPYQREKIKEFKQNIKKNKNLLIYDRSAVTISELRTSVANAVRKHNINLIVIDYMQAIEDDTLGKYSSRTERVANVSKSLKQIAKDFNVAVVALASLNREVENRPDKRPWSHDVKDSGQIESDADVVMMIYREGRYDPNANPTAAELIFRKIRCGEEGTIYAKWLGSEYRFEDQPEGYDYQYDLRLKPSVYTSESYNFNERYEREESENVKSIHSYGNENPFSDDDEPAF